MDIVMTFIRQKLEYWSFTQSCVCNGATGQTHCKRAAASNTVAGSGGCRTLSTTTLLPGATQWDATINAGGTPSGHQYDCWFTEYSASHTILWQEQHLGILTQTGITSTRHTFTAGTTTLAMDVCTHGGDATTISLTGGIDEYGAGMTCDITTPGPVVVPTQPTDLTLPPSWACTTTADLCTRLQQLSQKVDWLRRDVTLQQRYGLPFAYIQGSAHVGLTGAGSFAIQGLVGLLVDVTTPPAGGRVLPGNPPYLWDCGWMSVNDSNGMIEEKRITRSGYVWLPIRGELATSFNWALDPGVVLRVVELLPEP